MVQNSDSISDHIAPACHPLMAWMNIVCVGDWQLPLLPTTEHEKYAHWAVIWKLDFGPEYFALGQHESLQFGESLHFGPSWAIETAIGDCHVYSIYALETVLLNWISTWRCDTTLCDCCSCGPTRPQSNAMATKRNKQASSFCVYNHRHLENDETSYTCIISIYLYIYIYCSRIYIYFIAITK